MFCLSMVVKCFILMLTCLSNFLQVFKDLGVPYEVYELDKEANGMAVQDVLDNMTGARTVSMLLI